ncbi:LysR substrate-binding domain-containing protein [Saccharopolyspora spinosa]|uniref:DNA-binding transcriptional LysR family regulator n=1 Tax=Saccharopolyspora spinosa TaxID=60894 RepID=A0A2N3XUK3_SACSN|nr:LysR substrate-binding domain-containing protein [Saccharopolyspora spinosa]PKW14335.1 DNA-binding transcriptional LysR family regulator [Saccharopolyspora spinosa]
MDVDVAVLRSFVVLAEELHFARAAVRLHIEQPALSQRIKRLERRIGVQLFVRDSRNVCLTPAGQEFAVEVGDVLHRLDAAIGRAVRTADGTRGTMRIAYTLSVGYEALPVLLGQAERTLPDVTIEAVELWEADVLAGVVRRDWDGGFVRYHPDHPEVTSLLMRHESLIVAMPDTHPLSGRNEVRLAELRDEHFVTTPTELAPGYQALLDEVFDAAGFVPHTVRNTVPGNRIMALQRRKNAVALLPASAGLTHPTGIAFVPVVDDFAHLPVWLVHRHDAAPPMVFLAETLQLAARDQGWLVPPVRSR